MTYRELSFESAGERCSAWHFRGTADQLAGPSGKPVVVMAHGFGGTVDSGLEPFAQRLQKTGLDVLAFDYRGFGSSGGQLRQSLSIKRQLQDYRAAVTAAQSLPGVDPERIVLWGVSFSGGHVLRVAADRSDIAAVIALTPLTSGAAVSRAAVKERDVLAALRWTAVGAKSRVAVAMGREPTLMPLVARPGRPGALALDGAYESYTAMAGPTWRNEIDSAVGLEVARIFTSRSAQRLKCPLLVQIADFDRYVPAQSVVKTAAKGRAEVRHYPCDHFDVWPGHDWFESVAEHQAAFLARVLGPSVV